MRMKKNYIKPNIEVITPVLEREVLDMTVASNDITDPGEIFSNENNMGFEDDEPNTQNGNTGSNIWE